MAAWADLEHCAAKVRAARLGCAVEVAVASVNEAVRTRALVDAGERIKGSELAAGLILKPSSPMPVSSAGWPDAKRTTPTPLGRHALI